MADAPTVSDEARDRVQAGVAARLVPLWAVLPVGTLTAGEVSGLSLSTDELFFGGAVYLVAGGYLVWRMTMDQHRRYMQGKYD